MTAQTIGMLKDNTGETWVASWDESGTITAISEQPMNQDEKDDADRNPSVLSDWHLSYDEDVLTWAREADEAGKFSRHS